MKILQLGKFYPIKGGVEKVMYDLTLGLSERGIECDMMCAAAHGEGWTIKLNKKARLICCQTWMKMAATMISPAMIFKLRKVCKNYDVIHLHHPDPMAALALYCSGYKGTVMLHWHSDILKQKQLLRLFMPLQNWILKRACMIIGTSPVYLKESPFLQQVQEKTVALPIGVNEMVWRPEDAEAIRKRYPGKKIIFSLGRLVEYKGFTYLIDAARYLGDDYVVLIGGTGPLGNALQQQIEENGLSERVHLLGFVRDEELPGYYGACDLFCLSSIQKTEAFAIVQIEAMSCGKPVVATKIPQSGVAWVNEDGVSGINVTPCNGEELAEAIKTITRDEETYAAFSARARKRYEEWFTKEKMIENCYRIYCSKVKE